MFRSGMLVVVIALFPITVFTSTTTAPTTSWTTNLSSTTSTAATTTPPTEDCDSTNGTDIGVYPGAIDPNQNCTDEDCAFSVHDADVFENGKFVAVTVTRDGECKAARVRLTITASSTNAKTALKPVKGNINFPECVTVVDVVIPLIDDCVYEENDEVFDITISHPSSGTIGTPTATLTIMDDDFE